VLAVLAAAFLNLLGFTMTIPITPVLKQHFSLQVGASFGMLTSAYPLGMMVGLALWPNLSDRVGRRPVMSLSLFGNFVGLALQGMALLRQWPLPALLALRVFTGSCSGSSPVAKAYLADVGSTSGQLPRYIAWRDAASTLAYIVGPTLGGLLYTSSGQSLSAVVGASAVGSLVAAVLVAALVREDAPPLARRAAREIAKLENPDAPILAGEEIVACPLGAGLVTAVATVCIVTGLFSCGAATFDSYFGVLAMDRLGIDTRTLGMCFTALSSLSFLVSTACSAAVLRRLGAVRTCCLGLLAAGSGLVGLGYVCSAAASASRGQQVAFWSAAALYQVGQPLYNPSIPTMLLQCVPPYRRGAIMGLDSAVNTVARILAPILLGTLYKLYGAATCFYTAGGVVLAAATTAAARRLLVLRSMDVVR
jgi:MFS family permease